MIDLFSRIPGDGGAARLAAAMAFTFAAVFCFVLAVSVYVRGKTVLKRRAMSGPGLSSGAAAAENGWFGHGNALSYQGIVSASELLVEAERSNAVNQGEASELRREMLRAGFFGPRSVFWYHSTRLALLGLGGLCGYILFSYLFSDAWNYSVMLGAVAFGCAGFLLPNRYIAMRQQAVFQKCREGFPDFIDLMIVCAEAGLGPRASFDRISREIAKAYPILGAHCYLCSLEIRAGSTLHDALFNLSHRIHVEEAAMLASLLEQTEQLGTSVTDALRVYSDEMRERRLLRAEEKAHALPAKLVLPLGLFVFPVILVVILLPAVVRVKSAIF